MPGPEVLHILRDPAAYQRLAQEVLQASSSFQVPSQTLCSSSPQSGLLGSSECCLPATEQAGGVGVMVKNEARPDGVMARMGGSLWGDAVGLREICTQGCRQPSSFSEIQLISHPKLWSEWPIVNGQSGRRLVERGLRC